MSVLRRSPGRRQAGLVVATFLAVIMAGVTSALYFTSVDAKAPGPSLVRDVADQTDQTDQTTVTVTKTDSVNGISERGGTFDWTVTVAVAGGSTSEIADVTDTLPAGLTYGTPTDVAAEFDSASISDPLVVRFTLPIGTEPGDYSFTIPVTVPEDAACEPYTNNVEVEGLHPVQLAAEALDEVPQIYVSPASDTVGVGCPVEQNGILIITKVKDTSPGVPAADGSTFNGTIDDIDAWQATNIGFGESTSQITLIPGLHTVAETVTSNGWTPVGWANWVAATGQCDSNSQVYTGGESSQVNIVSGETTHVCVMNTKTADVGVPNIELAKSDDVGGSVLPGETFNWIITATVKGGPTKLAAVINDILPASLTIDGTISEGAFNCSQNPTSFSCILPADTPDGTYQLSVPVTMPGNVAKCQSFTNSAAISDGPSPALVAAEDFVVEQTYSGTPASDTVTVGCGSVIVKKEYITHGGTKDVPVVHVEDVFDPTPAINPSGENDETHSEWMPVEVLTRGTVSVWEDLDITKWRAYAPPTLSGDCAANAETFLTVGGLQAIENATVPPDSPPNTRVEIRIGDAGTCTVTFHNERLTGTILVSKIATVNGTQQVSEQVGWHITASSAACGVSVTQDTNAGGTTSFTVPAGCSDYVVSEDKVNAPFAGYAAQSPSSVSGISVAAGGTATVTFTNARAFFNPPQICAFGCTPLVVTTPTPTPIPPTVVPTPTVAPPTATPTNTPAEAVAGEKTPGALATPLPPSTGTGGPESSASNLFLALIGLLALSGGLAVLGAGMRARR